ncbi:nuclear transport factor 2 family protein [Arvimicrobium flavum]|uniref:nuclear transport factor 2 family protein n=1 Tax=Arvimicrobium flavum TaxID=3393320 RepID=UPI00237B13F4|nr:nuclear transport factor 2 family protein [Mesorhizobium shangrilense]
MATERFELDLIDRYCAVWSEADANRRATLLTSLWAEHATYTDPTTHASGAGELLAHIAGVQARRPGSRVVRTGGVDLHHDVGYFAWQALSAEGAVLREGVDVAFFNTDGTRIERIIGFFAPFAAHEEAPATTA